MATMKDIAKLAGVSVATVSRVMAGHPSVTEETREKVLAIIEETGYSSNSLARGLRQMHTNLVAVVLPDVTNPFCTDILRGIDDVLYTNSYIPLFHDSDNDPENEEHALQSMRSMGVAGALIVPCDHSSCNYPALLGEGTPVLHLVDTGGSGDSQVVRHDYEQAGLLAARHMLEQGRSSIVCLTGGALAGALLAQGYGQAMSEANKEPRTFLAQPGRKSIQLAIQKMLGTQGMRYPDGLIADSDRLASWTLHSLAEQGADVSAISVVGFGNTALGKTSLPGFSSIGPSGYQVGMLGAQRLLDCIGEGGSQPESVILQPKLTVRGCSYAKP